MAGRSLGPTVRAGWRVVSTRPRGAPDPISLEALRVALRAATGTRSLRQVAAEVGISHTGLRGFLAGAKPHPHTRHKLERWVTELSARRIREVGGAYAGDAGAGPTPSANPPSRPSRRRSTLASPTGQPANSTNSSSVSTGTPARSRPPGSSHPSEPPHSASSRRSRGAKLTQTTASTSPPIASIA